MNEVVGENVQRLREGMTQAELARRLASELNKDKMDPASITRLEQGKRPTTVNELAALAKILKVTPEALLSEDRTSEMAKVREITQLMDDILGIEMEIRELLADRRLAQAALQDQLAVVDPNLFEPNDFKLMRSHAYLSADEVLGEG